MPQSLVKYSGSSVRDGGEHKYGFATGFATQFQRLAALAWAATLTCVFAVDASVQIPEGRSPLVQAYLVTQGEKLAPLSGNSLAAIEPATGLPQAPFFTASEPTQCREKAYRFCRDLAQSEFRLTSLRFMVPEVRGLTPKSLTVRRNSVIANYTFR